MRWWSPTRPRRRPTAPATSPERLDAVLTIVHLALHRQPQPPGGNELLRWDLVTRAHDLAATLAYFYRPSWSR
jgi:predicted RNA polymerase sigma factor